MPLIAYGRCKGEWDAYKGDEKHMEHWKGTATYEAVQNNTFELKVERLKHRGHAEFDPECRICRTKGANRG